MKINDIFEKINKEVFKPGFHKSKSILNGEYTLIADYKDFGGEPALSISVIDQDMIEVGFATFLIKNGILMVSKHLEAYKIYVNDDHRRKGIATEIYKFAKELGNTIKPSNIQTVHGKSMWKGFKKNKSIK